MDNQDNKVNAPPSEVWVMFDGDNLGEAFDNEGAARSVAASGERILPNQGPYSVARYVSEEAMQAAVVAERESCARLTAMFIGTPPSSGRNGGQAHDDCAAGIVDAIRARKDQL